MKIKRKYQLNKNYIMKKNRAKVLIQKQNNRFLKTKVLVRSFVELENRIKALKEFLSKNDSENNQNFHRWSLLQTTEKKLCPKQN